MIYLIRVEYKEITLLKVGYAKNIKKRIDQYTTENPLFELIDYREGDRKLENLLHELFKEYRFEKGREWFYYNDFIVENFNRNFEDSYVIERIKKKIDKTKSFSGRLRLYCEFKEKYSEIDFIEEDLQKYINILGIDKCRELGYKENLLYKEIYNSGNLEKLEQEDERIINTFLTNYFFKATDFREKMKMYCLFSDEFKDNEYIMEALHHRVDQKFLQYYRYYGTSGCSSRKFQESELISGWKDAIKEDKLKDIIYSKYNSGDRILMSEIKSDLKKIYVSLNLSKTAKATDLGEYFEISKTNIITEDGIKRGFKLGKRLQ